MSNKRPHSNESFSGTSNKRLHSGSINASSSGTPIVADHSQNTEDMDVDFDDDRNGSVSNSENGDKAAMEPRHMSQAQSSQDTDANQNQTQRETDLSHKPSQSSSKEHDTGNVEEMGPSLKEDDSEQQDDASTRALEMNNTLQSASTAREDATNAKTSEKDGISNAADKATDKEEEIEDPDDEDGPLDLVKMRDFEFDQVSNLTPTQLRRYEQYRRSDLKSMKVKKLLVALNPMSQKVSDQYVIAIKGLAKLFVGDVVETGLEVRKERGEKGALTPKQIREAYRRLRKAGVVPSTGNEQMGSLW